MGRMVKCAFTGKIADSSCLYKVGRQWFEDKETYINYLKSKDISYEDIFELLTEDRNFIISENTKNQIIKILLNDMWTEK